ncbi:MAG TPA: PLP-dependent aminotransferase family protein [Kofleriaceae bacterium]|nr:PLP-dependent aminotransferase family protein [Kofleriaceae bacterium]
MRRGADQMPVLSSLLLRLDRHASVPLHEQIFRAVRERILGNELAPNTRLPSSRQLARDLGVARTTVLQALDGLVAEGLVVTHRASATRVAAELPAKLEGRRADARAARPPRLARAVRANPGAAMGAPLLGAGPRAFRPGVPALDLFPIAVWSRISARVHARATTALLAGSEPNGDSALRTAIAAHVSSSRGLRCTAEHVFITSGTQQAFDEILRLAVDPGAQVWVENPGYVGALRAVIAVHATPVGVPVDAYGLDVAAGIARAPRARAVMLAPSHQYPLGVTLGLSRRLALLRWASRARAVIIEDDYDSEFHHRGRPLMALAGLDPSALVVYIGTFSKSLFPGLHIGYFVVPPQLAAAVAASRASQGAPAPVLDQATLAEFFAAGHFASHLRRMRATYRERSEALEAALDADCGDLLVHAPCDTGLELVATFPAGMRVSDRRVAREAADRDVEVAALSSYGLGRARRNGLVLGFGCVRPSQMRSATQRLARAITAAL